MNTVIWKTRGQRRSESVEVVRSSGGLLWHYRLAGAWEADREFGELALAAVDCDRAAMLLGDDVPADRQAEPSAFACGLGREERLKQLVPDLGRDAGAIVADANLHSVTEIARRYLQRRAEVGRRVVALSFGGGVEAVAKQVEQDAGHLLRRQLDRGNGRDEIALQSNVEILVPGARPVIGEVERLFDQAIQVDLAALAGGAARMLEHALDNAVGAPAMLGDLFEIAGQHADDLVDSGTSVGVERG